MAALDEVGRAVKKGETLISFRTCDSTLLPFCLHVIVLNCMCLYMYKNKKTIGK